MAFGFYGGPDFFDLAVDSNEKRAADDAHEFAAHEFFFLPGSEGRNKFVVGIAEQGEIQFLLCLKRSLGFDRISAQAEDGYTQFVEVLFCVTKLGRFDSSTGSVGFGVKKDEETLAFIVAEGDVFVFVRFQVKVRGFVAGF
jgi:hypothetical protein